MPDLEPGRLPDGTVPVGLHTPPTEPPADDDTPEPSVINEEDSPDEVDAEAGVWDDWDGTPDAPDPGDDAAAEHDDHHHPGITSE